MVSIALAQSQAQIVAQGFLAKLNAAIFFPLITLMMAVALLVFLYGCFEYIKNSTSQEGRQTGSRHILWGVIGMLVMLSAFAILEIAASTFDLDDELNDAVGTSQVFNAQTDTTPTILPATSPVSTVGNTDNVRTDGSEYVTATDLTAVRDYLVSESYSADLVDSVIAGLDDAALNETTLRRNLQIYVDEGVIPQSVADSVVADVAR